MSEVVAKFRAGDFSLGKAPQSGRGVAVGSDQIETLTENNQCYTMREIAHKNTQVNKLIDENENCVFYRKN